VAAQMRSEMSAHHLEAISGTTDSETLFHFILSRMEQQPVEEPVEILKQSLQDVADWATAHEPSPELGLNVLLTDGTRMLGSRWMRTLFHTSRDRVLDCQYCKKTHARVAPPADYHATLIASEPTTDGDWDEVPDRSVFEIDETEGIRLREIVSP